MLGTGFVRCLSHFHARCVLIMLVCVFSLQRMGAAMGDELDKHNRQLAEIDARVDEGQAGLKKATRTEARIMRG